VVGARSVAVGAGWCVVVELVVEVGNGGASAWVVVVVATASSTVALPSDSMTFRNAPTGASASRATTICSGHGHRFDRSQRSRTYADLQRARSYGFPEASVDEQIIGTPLDDTPVAPTGEQYAPGVTVFGAGGSVAGGCVAFGGDVAGGAVGGGAVARGAAVVGGTVVTGGEVVVGGGAVVVVVVVLVVVLVNVVVTGAAVVVVTCSTAGLSAGWSLPPTAPPTPPTIAIAAIGEAIFAHSGHARYLAQIERTAVPSLRGRRCGTGSGPL
jgi:hypothetical protein